MDIIGVGMGRTGTFSLKLALERLGLGPCYHMSELTQFPERLPLWEAAARGDAVDWDEVFFGYRSTVDWPSVYFWRELAAAYPAARIVLTIRDADSWYDSTRKTLYDVGLPRHRLDAALHRLEGRRNPYLARRRQLNRELIWHRTFADRFADRDHAVEVYRRHLRQVQAEIPPERLLVYEVGQGWEPLCEFLQCPVPDEPFPRTNSATDFRGRMRSRRRALLNPLAARDATWPEAPARAPRVDA